jgi:hypothetical protein
MFNQNNTPQFVCYPKQTVENFQDNSTQESSVSVVNQESIINQATGFVVNQASGFLSNFLSQVPKFTNNIVSEVPKFTSNIVSEVPRFTSNIVSEVSSSSTIELGNSTPVSSNLSSTTSVVNGVTTKNICIDNTCLTEEDLKKLLKIIK